MALNSKSRQYIRALLRNRDGDHCSICHKPMDFFITRGGPAATIDHIIPLSEYGSDKLINLRLAHESCNMQRHQPAKNQQRSKLHMGKVTINWIPSVQSYGYIYRGECFGYTWSMKPFSKKWCQSLQLIAIRSGKAVPHEHAPQ